MAEHEERLNTFFDAERQLADQRESLREFGQVVWDNPRLVARTIGNLGRDSFNAWYSGDAKRAREAKRLDRKATSIDRFQIYSGGDQMPTHPTTPTPTPNPSKLKFGDFDAYSARSVSRAREPFSYRHKKRQSKPAKEPFARSGPVTMAYGNGYRQGYGGTKYRRRPKGSRSKNYGRQSNRVLGRKLKRNVGGTYSIARTGGYTGQEMKFADFSMSGDALATTWTSMSPDQPLATVNCVSAVAGGSNENERNGRTYRIHRIQGMIQLNVATNEAETVPLADIGYRIMLIMDTQTNKTALTPTDVMDAGGDAGSTLGQQQLKNVSRFKILWDTGRRNLRIDNDWNGVAGQWGHNESHAEVINFDKKLNIKVVTTGDTAGVIAQMTDNTIHLIACSTSTALLSRFNVRLRFTDS